MNAIEIRNICKNYGDCKALSDITLDISEGEIFGLIGPDGAGKTTLFRILATLLLPDGGNASINGTDVIKDYEKIRCSIGYMPGQFSLYQDLSVEENLDFFATVFGTTIKENYDNIKEIYSQIEPFKDRRAGKLSGGMKQKLALCCALVHNPSILFLDEPTTGVDAVSRKDFWNMLYRIRESGVTIVVSTPYMDEASKCDRIALIQHGRIIETGTPEQIKESYPYTLLSVKGKPAYPMLRFLRRCPGIISCFSFGSEHHAAIDPKTTDERTLAGLLESNGFKNCRIKEIKPTVEDCFMQLAGKVTDNTLRIK